MTLRIAKLTITIVGMLALALLVAGGGWATHCNAKEPAEKPAPKQAAAEDQPRTDRFGDPLPPEAVARLGTIRYRREQGQLWQFAVSPDGRTLATAAGRSLTLYDIVTGRPLRRFPFPQLMHCLAFAPDGKSVAVGGGDGIARRMDLASGKELQRFVGHQHQAPFDPFYHGVWGVAFTPDGRKLITQGSDETVRVWETHSGKELLRLGIKTQWPDSICISPNGKLLAVWAQEAQRTLRLWDLDAGKEIRKSTYPDVVKSVAFSPDNKSLAVAYGSFQWTGGRIVLLDLDSGKELRASPSEKGDVTAMAFSPDGKTLASAGFGWSMRFWNVGSMKELRATPLLPPLHVVHQLAFSPDGKTLISRGGEHHVRLWDVASGKERIAAAGPSEAIDSLAYSPNAKLVAAVSANKIWLWSATTGKLLRTLVSPGISWVTDAAFSADGRLLVSLLRDGTIQLWDVETGKEQRRIETTRNCVEGIALAPDGKTFAACNHPGVVQIWRFNAATKPRDFEVPSADPQLQFVGSPSLASLGFSPDGKFLYAVSGLHFSILRWDTATGKALPPIGQSGGRPDKIVLSPDGRSIAALGSGSLHLWEIASKQTRLVQDTALYGSSSAAFSPDGRLLALAYSGDPYERENAAEASKKEQVYLVRVADGKVIHRFTGHRGGINAVSFSPDGRTLASGGQDTTVLLWDVTKLRKDGLEKRDE